MAELTQASLQDMFSDFLKTFRDRSGALKYRDRISQIPVSGAKSLLVDFDDLSFYNVDLAEKLVREPDETLAPFKRAAYEAIRVENATYAERILNELMVRIRGLPTRIELRRISTEYLDQLISVAGMVVRTSELRPLATKAAWKCKKCGHINEVDQKGPILLKPRMCNGCKESKEFELEPKKTKFVDYQVIRIQELPEELPPGQLPQTTDVSLIGDLVNKARPGDRVIVTGILRAEPESAQSGVKYRLFRSRLDGNNVETLGETPEKILITKEDEEIIKSIASQQAAYERLIASIAPSIYGYETQKEAMLLQIVGAPQRVLEDGTTLRGDINVLLIGDPGTAKSEMLKYVARVAPRALYTSGRGSTAAGLTAAVVREKSGMMMLEAGAVVLADQGLACIDEFDKMRPEDRSALHECMEQQTCSVAKGGIVATLNARTAIFAALNPILGKYDPHRNLTDNVNLPIPLLTRFDLIFVLRDVPERAGDERVARHILETHRKSSIATPPPISVDLLRKYIIYAKRINPVLTPEAEEKLLEYYLKMRSVGDAAMITITPRQLESLIRLATARARLMLRDKVNEEDALRAISLMERMLTTVSVDVKTGKVDFGVMHGRPLSERTLLETALDVFKSLTGSEQKPVEAKMFIEELIKTGKFKREEAERMLQILHRSGQIYESKPGFFKKAV